VLGLCRFGLAHSLRLQGRALDLRIQIQVIHLHIFSSYRLYGFLLVKNVAPHVLYLKVWAVSESTFEYTIWLQLTHDGTST
jgi:hypothetical protein